MNLINIYFGISLPKSSHFWSLSQKYEFALADQTRKVSFFKKTFRCMQPRAVAVVDPTMQAKFNVLLSKLASGVHPTVSEILELKPLFKGEPFHLNCLYPRHKVSRT